MRLPVPPDQHLRPLPRQRLMQPAKQLTRRAVLRRRVLDRGHRGAGLERRLRRVERGRRPARDGDDLRGRCAGGLVHDLAPVPVDGGAVAAALEDVAHAHALPGVGDGARFGRGEVGVGGAADGVGGEGARFDGEEGVDVRRREGVEGEVGVGGHGCRLALGGRAGFEAVGLLWVEVGVVWGLGF